jgi:hypothetical protein
MSRLYGCPTCRATDALSTVERLYGTCATYFTDDPIEGGEGGSGYDPCGETSLAWETSEAVGLTCTSCGWEWIPDPERALSPEEMIEQMVLTDEEPPKPF